MSMLLSAMNALLGTVVAIASGEQFPRHVAGVSLPAFIHSFLGR